MSLAIHVIENLQKEKPLDLAAGIWESGHWRITEATARLMVAKKGDFYLHSARSVPSHFGGTVIGYRVQVGGELDGRIIFKLHATMAHKGVRTDRTGWGMYIKRVGFEPEVRKRVSKPAVAVAA